MNRRAMIGSTMAAAGLLMSASVLAQSAAPDEAAIDAIIAGFMAAFAIPGLAVAIIRLGAPDFAKGYGVRILGKPDKVDADTLFAIASNSKAFTAAALALLVDEGKIGWEDPVIRHIPEFKMYDPVVTQMMTVRDLLVHRSGLSLGEGDLMVWPATTHTVEDILHGLQFLKPDKGFRVGYAYDNILYIIAGILLQRVTGQTWEAFVSSRLLKPVGMGATVPARSLVRTQNIAGRHARLGPPLRGLGPVRVVVRADEGDNIDAAGGINASAHDILAWFHVQLAQGKLPGGGRLWSEQQASEMWTPQTITSSGPGQSPEQPTRSVMTGYALGWNISTYRGERMISHAGGLEGQVTHQVLLPERGIAVAVYANSEDNPSGLYKALLDHLLATPGVDWLARSVAEQDKDGADALKQLSLAGSQRPPSEQSLPLKAYAGRYSDPWYGDIIVAMKLGQLHIDFTRTPAFKGNLEPWGRDSFRTRFSQDVEDAVINFAVQSGAVTKVTMKALSPIADFSYDFQDLTFLPR
jgi:CubicO group peptidase (beta-lactamase class C family)